MTSELAIFGGYGHCRRWLRGEEARGGPRAPAGASNSARGGPRWPGHERLLLAAVAAGGELAPVATVVVEWCSSFTTSRGTRGAARLKRRQLEAYWQRAPVAPAAIAAGRAVLQHAGRSGNGR
jgi:hypothetical protein